MDATQRFGGRHNLDKSVQRLAYKQWSNQAMDRAFESLGPLSYGWTASQIRPMIRKGSVDETTRISTSNYFITCYEQPDGRLGFGNASRALTT